MTIDDDRNDHDDVDPLVDQVRPKPNPELVNQHDEREDPLDEAIEAEVEASTSDVPPSPCQHEEVLIA